jgi:hypothetical protein
MSRFLLREVRIHCVTADGHSRKNADTSPKKWTSEMLVFSGIGVTEWATTL